MRIKTIVPGRRSRWLVFALPGMMFLPAHAHASMFQGEALDTMANVLSWVVLALVPLVGITAFWLVHILPEKIAEKKKHPQTKAIQCLCLLSLFFGGLLWPLAWLWAYSKPVMHKLAYGTDVDESITHHDEKNKQKGGGDGEAERLKQLRAQVAELESKLAGKSAVAEGKA